MPFALFDGVRGSLQFTLEIAEGFRNAAFRQVNARILTGGTGQVPQRYQSAESFLPATSGNLRGHQPQGVVQIIREGLPQLEIDLGCFVPLVGELVIAPLD